MSDELRTALEWYADPKNNNRLWVTWEDERYPYYADSAVMQDKGECARQALARPPAPDAGARVTALTYEPCREVLGDLLVFTSTVMKMVGLDHMLTQPEMERARALLRLDGDADARTESGTGGAEE